MYKFLPMALRVTFLAFPSVSSLAFKAFRCDDLDRNDDSSVGVQADLAVECWDENGGCRQATNASATSRTGIFLYPVCVPCCYCVLFWKVRMALWNDEPTTLSTSVTFLTEEYQRPSFSGVYRGAQEAPAGGRDVGRDAWTLNQLVLAFIVVLCFLVMLMVAKPYKRPEDDVIALATGFALVMFFFFASCGADADGGGRGLAHRSAGARLCDRQQDQHGVAARVDAGRARAGRSRWWSSRSRRRQRC